MDAIWIHLDGQRYGPYPPAQVTAMLTEGLVPADADVWWPAACRWVKAEELHVAATSSVAVAVPAGVAAAAVPAGVAAATVPAGVAAATVPAPGCAPTPDSHHSPDGHLVIPVPGQPHRPRPHLHMLERASYAGRSDETNHLAFAAVAAALAALVVSWVPALTGVTLLFAAAAVVVAVAALVSVTRGAPGRGMALAGLAVAVVSAVLALAVQATFGAPQDAGTAQAQTTGTSPVKIILADAVPSRATTVLQAQLFNSGDETVDGGMFTVEATIDRSVVGQTTEAVPVLQPGQSATVRVVFLDTLPPATQYRVTKVTTLP